MNPTSDQLSDPIDSFIVISLLSNPACSFPRPLPNSAICYLLPRSCCLSASRHSFSIHTSHGPRGVLFLGFISFLLKMTPAAHKCLIFRREFGAFHFLPSLCSASLPPPRASDCTCGGCFLSTRKDSSFYPKPFVWLPPGSLSCALETGCEALPDRGPQYEEEAPSIWQSLPNVMCHISLS